MLLAMGRIPICCCFLLLTMRAVALVFFNGGGVVDLAGKRSAVIGDWGRIDLSGVVVVRSAFGVPSSGALMTDGRHVLTAAHCVAGSRNVPQRGWVEIWSGGECQVVPWKRVKTHPKYEPGGAWDVALVELAREIPEPFAQRYSLTSVASGLPATILRAGWGMSGGGARGESGKAGLLQAGLNRHELRTHGELAALFKKGSTDLPLLLSDFDGDHGKDGIAGIAASAGITIRPDPGLGALECHLGNGDSGGPVFSRGPDGVPRITAVQVGRTRRGTDTDHRLNGSWGELAIDVEASRIRGWVHRELSNFPDKISENRKTNLTNTP